MTKKTGTCVSCGNLSDTGDMVCSRCRSLAGKAKKLMGDVERKKILIVDDDPNLVLMLKKRITSYGYDVITAADGVEGYEATLRDRPDLIVLDVLMPKMTGYDMVKKLHARSDGSQDIPVIVMTGRQDMRDFFIDSNICIFVTKPVDAKELLDVIDDLLAKSVEERRQMSLKKQVEAETPKKQKIIVIDDEPNIVLVLKKRLEANQYEVITASNGAEGFEKIKKEKPDLIITDVLMPGMTGYDLVQKLKSDADTQKIPVVVMTARPDMKDFFAPWDMQSFVSKPINSEALLEAIRDLLKRRA